MYIESYHKLISFVLFKVNFSYVCTTLNNPQNLFITLKQKNLRRVDNQRMCVYVFKVLYQFVIVEKIKSVDLKLANDNWSS